MKDLGPVYLDQEGLEQLQVDIARLQEELNKVNAGRREAFDAGAGDGWDSPEFEEIERQERIILGQLNERYSMLARVVIVEKHNNEEIIDIGDVVSVEIIFGDDDIEEITFKLVGGNANFDSEIKEISINSPLGAAVHMKKIGENSSYAVNKNVFNIFIKSKGLEQEQTTPSR